MVRILVRKAPAGDSRVVRRGGIAPHRAGVPGWGARRRDVGAIVPRAEPVEGRRVVDAAYERSLTDPRRVFRRHKECAECDSGVDELVGVPGELRPGATTR